MHKRSHTQAGYAAVCHTRRRADAPRHRLLLISAFTTARLILLGAVGESLGIVRR